MVLGYLGATPARRFRVVRQAVSSVALTDGAVRDSSEAAESALSDICMASLLAGFLVVGVDANDMGWQWRSSILDVRTWSRLCPYCYNCAERPTPRP